VRDAFEQNFAERGELGGACCAYYRGEKAVDLWGGVRNKVTGEPWDRDTMVVVHSATKGLAAMTLAIAHSRGWLDYEERVAAYWPEFAQQGKEKITVRQLLAHQAGLFAFDEPVDAVSSRTSTDQEVMAHTSRRGAGDTTGVSRSPWGSTKGEVMRGRLQVPHWTVLPTRSPRRSARTSTSAFRTTFPIPVWLFWRPLAVSPCYWDFRFGSLWRR
jgi:CubicO group peptidase (beta-lactamase class C family)